MAIKTEKVIKNAEKYVAKGKLEAAIKEYRKVLAENPNDTNTLNRVGDLYARLERYDEAVKLFTQIAEKYTRDGFFLKAIAIYKKIIKLDPTALAVYERLAELYHRQGLLNEARSQYQVLAEYYQKHENATSAITIYQRMSEIEPDNPSFHLKLAELYSSQRLTEKALKEYQKLAVLMIEGDSVDETVPVYGKAIELAPENLSFMRLAVGTLHEGGHTGAAAKVLARATELNPEAAEIAVQVGLVEPEPEPAPPQEAVPPEAASPDAGTLAAAPETMGFEAEPAAFGEESATFEIDMDASASGLPAGAEWASGPGAAAGAAEPGTQATSSDAWSTEPDLTVGPQPTYDPEVGEFEIELEDDFMADGLAADGGAEPATEETGALALDGGDLQLLESDAVEVVGEAPSFDLEESEAATDLLPMPELELQTDASHTDLYAEPEQDFGGGDEVFTLDLDDDEIPDTQVMPPDEVAATPEVQEFEFEVDLDDSVAGPVSSPALPVAIEESEIVEPGFGEATAVETSRQGAESVEIEWSMDGMEDLEVPSIDDEMPVVALPAPDLEPVVAEAPEVAPIAPESTETSPPAMEFPVAEMPAPEPPVDEASMAAAPALEAPALEAPILEVRAPDLPPAGLAAPEMPVGEAPIVADLPAAGFVPGEAPAAEAPVADPSAGEQPFELSIGLDEGAAFATAPAGLEPGLDETLPATSLGDATIAQPVAPQPAPQPPPAPTAPPPPPATTPPAAPTASDDPAAAAPPDAPVAEEPAVAPAVRREEDLVAEAKVFAKYGLREKAYDRLNELLSHQPSHLEGLSLKARLDLEAKEVDSAVETANLVSRLARESGDLAAWEALRAEFEQEGFHVADGVLSKEAPSKPAPVHDDRISQLLEDLSLESFDAPAASSSAVDSLLSQELGAEQPSAPAPSSAGPSSGKMFSLADELAIDGLEPETEEPAAEVPAEQPAPAPATNETADPNPRAELMDETGMSWLDEPTPTPAAQVETIFDEEDDFFDLAAELEDELGQDIDDVTLTSVEPQEQSLEEIIEGFKQGVAENLSSEDYDTHFNLGIAYREMGLLDEAIGEFQLAAKDPRYLVECASMLGICFLEKGLPDLAIRWYQKGLASPDIREEATLGLLYDLGSTYESIEEYDKAYKAFVEIYGFNTNFRDVSHKLQELAPLQT